MGKIALEDLQPGMVLARDVKDFSGRMILSTGMEITGKHLGIFRAWGITEADVAGVEQEDLATAATARIDPVLRRRAEAEAKGFYLRASFEHQIPAMLLDETRLRQILINLVGNAIKFTEKGGITMRLSATTPDPHCSTYNLVLEVADTGIGIPQTQIEKIFQAFVQSSGESSRQFGGTGLGLTITKRLVDMMGSAITVDTAANYGATFTVYLPRAGASG